MKNVADPNNLHPYVRSYDNPKQVKGWIYPSEAFKPRGWAYNVIRVQNCGSGTYRFKLKGDLVGIIISNKEFSIAMKMIFDVYWSLAK